jgi:hypothetical protein
MRNAATKLSLERPSRAKSPHARAVAKALEDEGSRVFFRLPITVHRKLKARAAEKGQTMAVFLVELLAREGITAD